MRRMLTITLLLVFIPAAVALAAPIDPAEALAAGRRHIGSKDFSQAAAILVAGLDSIGSLPDAQRDQARAALSFYAAVAFSGQLDDATARKHLAEYLRLSPTSRRIDAAKYDKRFVALFTELAQADTGDGTGFDKLYPGFATVSSSIRSAERGTWGQSAGLFVLASKAERREWESLTAIEDRDRFIEVFWKKRDRTPATPENEFRNEFERRVAFADQAFASRDARGALTDRGKVFVLLGPPAFVKRRPIDKSDRVRIVEEAIDIVNGTMENWVYAKEQLPMATSRPTVMFRFVTQQGIGDNIMQLDDPLAKQALSVAAAPPRG